MFSILTTTNSTGRRRAAPFVTIAIVILTTLGIAAPAAAQPVLTGIVVSAADSTPVPRATVTVETWDGQFVAEATTGADGRFRIAFEEPGTFVVSAAGPGFARSELQRVDLDPDDPTEIRLEVTPREMPESRPRLPEVEAGAGEIAGRVIDASSGRPLPGATVALLARRDDERIATVTSGPGGEFRLHVPATTTYRLRADLGDFGRSGTLIVEGSTERGLSLGLEGATGFGGVNRNRIESNQMIIARIGHLSVEDLEGIEVYREGAFTPADLAPDACQAISIWTGR